MNHREYAPLVTMQVPTSFIVEGEHGNATMHSIAAMVQRPQMILVRDLP